MPGKLVVSVSDLHLGRGNNQDDFGRRGGPGNGPALRSFCAQIADAAAASNAELTLLLNGDIVDFWEIVPDEQLASHDNAAQAIRDGLCFPAHDRAGETKAIDIATTQLDDATSAHPEFFEGLALLLSNPSTRVTYLHGNHDHAMAMDGMAQTFIDMLNDKTGTDVAHASNVTCGYSFFDPDVMVWAEHGDQFAGNDSRSPLTPWEQAAGFYFLRFVWNRIQAREDGPVRHGTLDLVMWALNSLTGSNRAAVRDAMRYLFEYFAARRDQLVPELVDVSILHKLYVWWFEHGMPLDPDVRDVAAVQQQITDATLANAGDVRVSVTGALSDVEYDQFPGLPGKREWIGSHGGDRYWQGVVDRFARAHAEPDFPRLDAAQHCTIFLGHTHRELYMQLNARDIERRQLYMNTGSWTLGHRRSYAWASTHTNNPLRGRGLRIYQP